MTFKIFGQDVVLIYNEEIGERGLDGECDPNGNAIHIHPTLQGDHHDTIILHELIHMACQRVGLSGVLNTKIEEIVCRVISQMITDNFTLTKK